MVIKFLPSSSHFLFYLGGIFSAIVEKMVESLLEMGNSQISSAKLGAAGTAAFFNGDVWCFLGLLSAEVEFPHSSNKQNEFTIRGSRGQHAGGIVDWYWSSFPEHQFNGTTSETVCANCFSVLCWIQVIRI